MACTYLSKQTAVAHALSSSCGLCWCFLQDVLGHPHTKAFVSHCGMHSVNEVAYHGVPLVALPFQFEQVRCACFTHTAHNSPLLAVTACCWQICLVFVSRQKRACRCGCVCVVPARFSTRRRCQPAETYVSAWPPCLTEGSTDWGHVRVGGVSFPTSLGMRDRPSLGLWMNIF